MTSCAPQSENQKRSSCHRGDSGNARPPIRVCSSGREDSFDGIRTIPHFASGTIFDFRISLSRVATEVEIVNAPADLEGEGQVWIFDRARTTSGAAKSISSRPSWTSFEISHRTIPEMLQVSAARIWRSFAVRARVVKPVSRDRIRVCGSAPSLSAIQSSASFQAGRAR